MIGTFPHGGATFKTGGVTSFSSTSSQSVCTSCRRSAGRGETRPAAMSAQPGGPHGIAHGDPEQVIHRWAPFWLDRDEVLTRGRPPQLFLQKLVELFNLVRRKRKATGQDS